MSCGLRDVVEFERAGRPAVLVASSVFEGTAGEQSAALGQPSARRLFVTHPIQDRTDAEMRELARSAVDPLFQALTA